MAKEEAIITEGKVIECLKDIRFRVKLDGIEHIVLAHLSGKIRILRGIKILLGDRVRVELSPYDLTRGRIIYRLA